MPALLAGRRPAWNQRFGSASRSRRAPLSRPSVRDVERSRQRLVSQQAALWTEPAAALPNTLAVGYAFGGHAVALLCLCSASVGLFCRLLACVLAAHTLVISAYLVHDAAHNTLCASEANNTRLGEACLWLCGGAAASFARVRHMHVRHHRDRQDTGVWFSHTMFLKSLPSVVRGLVYALEWMHVPAVEMIMAWQVSVRPFVRPEEAHRRGRVVAVALSRAAFFACICVAGGAAAAVSYVFSFLCFKQFMHFNDTYHHTFQQTIIVDEAQPVEMRGKTWAYENYNTLSNVVSIEHPWMNLLTLNNGYHNAHHHRTSVPWWRLPAHHARVYGPLRRSALTIPYAELVRSFHAHRLARLETGEYGGPDHNAADRAASFVGAHGVSFLNVV